MGDEMAGSLLQAVGADVSKRIDQLHITVIDQRGSAGLDQ